MKRVVFDVVSRPFLLLVLALSSCALNTNGSDSSESAGQELVAASQIDSGGPAVGSFAADRSFSGGTAYAVTTAITTAGVANAAPASVYQSERFGNFSYTVAGLTAGGSYTVRLHFAEIYWTAAGSRTFNTAINGTQVLSNFDIINAAGIANKAVARDFGAVANSAGQIVIVFTAIKDTAKVSAIEILSSNGITPPPPPPPSNQPPTVSTPAAANPTPVNGSTTNLSVLAADDGGEANLRYTWATVGSPPAAVTFSANGSNAAKSVSATFSASGSYVLSATVADAQGLTARSNVTVSVTIPTQPPPPPPPPPPPAGAPGGTGWQLVWSDEFTGTAVDTTRWKYWLDGQTRRSAVNHAANTFVSNGALTVRTTTTGGQLTSGGLESKLGFGSGYFETRGKVLGGWAGFWLQSPAIGNGGTPAVDGTEMDIMEACCPGAVQHAVHWGGYGASHQFVAQPIAGVAQSDWNTYGLEWTPTSYKFWVNGKLSWTFTTAISQRSDEVIRLTQETDGDFCGGQCDYLVDYVRVYRPSP